MESGTPFVSGNDGLWSHRVATVSLQQSTAWTRTSRLANSRSSRVVIVYNCMRQ